MAGSDVIAHLISAASLARRAATRDRGDVAAQPRAAPAAPLFHHRR